jgi:ABC-type Mn2+/Zn2+ transport system permease subunit
MTEATITTRRSILATIALGAAALSGAALAILLVGNVFGIDGANGDDETWNVGWIVFSWGALITLATGVAAYIRGRRGHEADGVAAALALRYFAVAVVGFAILLPLSS